MSEDPDALQEELVALLPRYALAVGLTPELAEVMESLAWNAPGEAASNMLCAYVLGDWDLDDQELARLWLIGRAMGYRRDELIPDVILDRAVPTRAHRPLDPPGDFVQTPLLRGGGHGWKRGIGGKSEFPEAWSDDDAIRHTMDVAQRPSGAVELPSGGFRAWGERDGVLLGVLVSPAGDVLTGYPVRGDDVVQNPVDVERTPHVQRLQGLLEIVPSDDSEPRTSLDELMAVGEWPHVIASLRALDLALSPEQRADLDDLARLTGLAALDE